MLKLSLRLCTLLLVLTACSGGAAPPTVEPTPTQTATPTATATPAPPERLPIGDNWQASRTDEADETTHVRIYEHYPIDHIQYDLVAVVGELDRVERTCMDSTDDVTASFSALAAPDTSDLFIQAEGFQSAVRYESGPLQIRPGCHISFFVQRGDQDVTGVLVESHCPLCFSQ